LVVPFFSQQNLKVWGIGNDQLKVFVGQFRDLLDGVANDEFVLNRHRDRQ
jgi:hypothetical protein